MYLERLHCRKSDRIPEKLYGSGPDAYLVQDWVVHRGKGAPRVSETFKGIANWYGKYNENFIKRKHRMKMDIGGIRYASKISKKC
jgi:hypothetical protein